ncbi:MAG: ABC transporter substrate-binding protein [Acidobacteriota bacterium]
MLTQGWAHGNGPRVARYLLVALSLGAAACNGTDPGMSGAGGGRRQEATLVPRSGGTVVLGLPSDLDSFNPYLSTQAQARDVTFQCYASLMEEQADFGQGPPTFLPALAASWEFSADRKEITFHLQPDAVWEDGRPVTANDVRFSHQAAISPEVGWLGAEVKTQIESVEVMDPKTVRFRFARVYPYQLMDANDGVILPEHVWSKVPFREWRSSGLDRHPVCSGAFTLERWTPNQSIEMVRNDRSFPGETPYLDRVIFQILPDAASGAEQLMAGQIDFWDRLSPELLPRLESQERVAVRRYPDRRYSFIAWNCARPLFRSAAVRRALTLAINRRRIVDDIYRGTAQLASGGIPPLYWAHDTSVKPHPFDAGAARDLLESAGWRDSDGDGLLDREGKIFRFDLEVPASSAIWRDIALMVQEDLRRVGIQASPVVYDRNVFNSRHSRHEFDAFIGAWRLPTKVDLAVIFTTAAIHNGGNYGGYSNSQLDVLLDKVRKVEDIRQAGHLLDRAQVILHREQPYTFLAWQDRITGFSARIRNIQPNAQSPLFHLRQWWIP